MYVVLGKRINESGNIEIVEEFTTVMEVANSIKLLMQDDGLLEVKIYTID